MNTIDDNTALDSRSRTGYEDILHMPHHVSSCRPRMPMRARAAQFAPFAALGHTDVPED